MKSYRKKSYSTPSNTINIQNRFTHWKKRFKRRLTKELFTTSKPTTILKVSKSELEQFGILLDHGLDVKTMITLSFKQSNLILKQLEEGKELSDILTRYQKGKYFDSLRILSKYISFQEAIACADKIHQVTQIFFQSFLKQVAYPIFIFLFSYFFILFFSSSILPSMAMYTENQSSEVMIQILKGMYTCIVLAGLTFIVLFLLSKKKKSLYVRIHQIPFVQTYMTYQFSIYFESLLSCHIHSIQCFEIIQQMHSNSYLTECASYILSQFQKGNSLESIFETSSYFDSTFAQFVSIGIHSSSLPTLLQLYQKRCQNVLNRWIKKTSIAIQMTSYVSVALLVFVFYQVMLMPLNMLNAF